VLLLFTILLLFILLSRIIENFTKIPSTLSLIAISFFILDLFPNAINLTDEKFDDIMYLMLPVILLPDILNISISELKKHYKEIIYLALIGVILSITTATIISPYLLPEYQFTVGMVVALFTMLMATDAISVTNIMSRFQLPIKLKIYAESESLFNDVTALIIFYFIALPMISGESLTLSSINISLFKVLSLSFLVGVVVAYIGYLTIKILRNSFDQLIVIYLIVVVSFAVSEHLEIAGILSIVTSVLTFKYLVQKELKKEKHHSLALQEHDLESSLVKFAKNVPALTKRNFKEYKKEAEFIGIFANAIVFTIVADIIDISSLLNYTKEILIVFGLTTIIRFGVISAMVVTLKLPSRWIRALTYSGAKGALAIIMVHSLPDAFIYKEMFTAIVIGNVLLSTFIYTMLLMRHITKYKVEYKEEIKEDNKSTLSLPKIVDLMQKDPLTGAYKKSFIKEMIEKELARVQRYKIEFSCILIDIHSYTEDIELKKKLGDLVIKRIRVNDYFGMFDDNRYIIVASGTSLNNAMNLAEKLETIISLETTHDSHTTVSFGITQVEPTDTYEMILNKLNNAITKAKDTRTPGRIEIEI
jgi:CPA1 family monovalent cation:H+ antiporter